MLTHWLAAWWMADMGVDLWHDTSVIGKVWAKGTNTTPWHAGYDAWFDCYPSEWHMFRGLCREYGGWYSVFDMVPIRTGGGWWYPPAAE